MDWLGFERSRLNWSGLDGLDRVYWIRAKKIEWSGADAVSLEWIVLDWIGVEQSGLDWSGAEWFALDWT